MADTLSHAFFYNSEDGDRIYDADSFEYLLKKFFTSGVFSGSCQVIADGAGMTCQMQAGYSNCDGKVRFFSEAVNLAIANAHATYDRIDTVVIERNDTDRDITCKVVTGTYSANPVAPAPVRSGGIYQLVVAEVYVAGGAVRITQSAITDKRPDTSVCGYVMCAVDTPDFSELYAQFTAQADEYIQVETADFEAWYQRMKDQLSEDAAGNLQEQIDDQQEQITALHAVATETTDGLMSASDKTNLEAISDVADNTIAIVASGNVAPKAISAGQYVIWNNALYTARSAIASGATLSTSNLAAVSNGGLNNLKASIDSLNSKIATDSIINTITFNINYESNHSSVRRSGDIVLCNIAFTTPDTVTNDFVLANLPFYVASSLVPICALWSGEECGMVRAYSNIIVLAATNWTPNRRVAFNMPLIVL